jgi:hypothetical protein
MVEGLQPLGFPPVYHEIVAVLKRPFQDEGYRPAGQPPSIIFKS